MFNLSVNKQVRKAYQPKKVEIKLWLTAALMKHFNQMMLEVSIVSAEISQQINFQYRNINQPTNVIALEYPESRDNFAILTGELILCDSIIVAEAQAQHKSVTAHYMHMLVHGMLHLQGYDHQRDADAVIMEKLEIEVLQRLGVENPYLA